MIAADALVSVVLRRLGSATVARIHRELDLEAKLAGTTPPNPATVWRALKRLEAAGAVRCRHPKKKPGPKPRPRPKLKTGPKPAVWEVKS